MAQDATAWSTPSATPGSAAGGLIQTAQGLLAATNAAGNTVRSSAYGNLVAAAAQFREVLLAFDPQADAAVEEQIAALAALL
jgi:hypothetical protein